jgi:predicted transcriptional regulator
MEDNDAPGKVNLNQVAEIISSYVRHTTVAADDLPRVIADVYRALAGVGQPAALPESRRPAVPIRRSVAPEFVLCLKCGHRARTLRRHLREAHGLGPDEYRARRGLSEDYPLRCKPRCPVILPANGPIAIEFFCRSASRDAKSHSIGRESGNVGLST